MTGIGNIRLSTPSPDIGETVIVMAGDVFTDDVVVANTQGNYVLAGSAVNDADYPALLNRIGYIGNTPWSPRFSEIEDNLNMGPYDLAYGNNTFVFVGGDGSLRTSTDTITWTARTSGTTSTLNAIVYGNGIFVYGGNGFGAPAALATSANGVTWTTRTSGTTSSILTLVYGNGLFVYGGGGGVVASSANGVTWTLANSTTTLAPAKLAYGNGLFLFGSSLGTLVTSTDANTWTTRTSGTSSAINAVTYGNGLYVYAGAGGVLATSANGVTWTLRTSGTTSGILSLEYGNGTYVYLDSFGRTGVSSNGITWSVTSYNSFARRGFTFFNLRGLAAKYLNDYFYAYGPLTIYSSSNVASDLSGSYFCDANTQYYAPSVNTAGFSRTYTLPTYTARTTPTYVTYIRGR